jgi:hypothetical protein
MLISKGKVPISEPWKILEVSIGQSPDVLAIRLAKELKRIHESGVQALVPMRRNSDGDAEWIVEHVYVRGANGSLAHLAKTPGIDFIRKENAEQAWIAELLTHEQPPSTRLVCGKFVRVLTGPCARMCGHVVALKPDSVTVQIVLRTKTVRVHTQPQNLQHVECLPEQQVFFYQSDLFAS